MKHHLFSRFTSVLLAVVLLAGLMGTPILATDNVLGAEPAATVEEQTAGSADESASGVDSAAAEQAEVTTTDEEESASSDSSTEPETSGEAVVSGDDADSTVPAGDDSDSTAISEEESTDSVEVTEPAEEAAVELTTSVLDENGSTVADVTVEAAEGVIPEGAKLVAELLTGEKADKAAAELNEAGVEYDGYMALDIHLENDKGEEVEPDGEVRVVMVAPAALPEDADPATVAVQHHEELDNGEVKVEEVASAADAADAAQPASVALFATNSVSDQSAAVTADNGAVTAEFHVESFSTFTITWNWEWAEKFEIEWDAATKNGEEFKKIGTASIGDKTASENDTIDMDELEPANITDNGATYIYTGNAWMEAGSAISRVIAIKGDTITVTEGWLSRKYNIIYVTVEGMEDVPTKTDDYRVLAYKNRSSNNWNTNTNAAEFYLEYKTQSGVKINDDIITSGRLNVLINGEEQNDYTYEWSRNGDPVVLTKVTGEQYNMGGNWLNVALDIEGLCLDKEDGDARKIRSTEYTYTVTVKDGETFIGSDTYTVPYYAQLMNGGFETPEITNWNNQLRNGYKGLVWRTTGVGTGDKVGQDIEIVRSTDEKDKNGKTFQSIVQETYSPSAAAEGVQFAELNCEAYGALYQDVLTTPNTNLNWALSHCGRDGVDTMALVIMPADEADTVTEQLTEAASKNNATSEIRDILDDIKDDPNVYVKEITSNKGQWNNVSGSYSIGEGQYLTRFFFVAVGTASSDSPSTVGNLIDDVWFSPNLPEPAPDKGHLVISKEMEGVDESDKDNVAFTFEVTGPEWDEKQTITLNEENNWTYTFQDIQVGQYTITEIDPENDTLLDAGYIYIGTEVNGVTVSPENDKVSVKVNLENQETVTKTFTNEYKKATTTLTLKKVFDGLTGADVAYLLFDQKGGAKLDDQFAFDVNYAWTDGTGENKEIGSTFNKEEWERIIELVDKPNGKPMGEEDGSSGGDFKVVPKELMDVDEARAALTDKRSYTNDKGAKLELDNDGNWVYTQEITVPTCGENCYFTVFEMHAEMPGYAKQGAASSNWSVVFSDGTDTVDGKGKVVGSVGVSEEIDDGPVNEEDLFEKNQFYHINVQAPVTVTFTNRYTGEMQLSKTVDSSDCGAEFNAKESYTVTIEPAYPDTLKDGKGSGPDFAGKTFTITGIDQEGQNSITQTIEFEKDNSSNKVYATLTIKPNVIYTLTDLPTIQYKVTEDQFNANIDGYELEVTYSDSHNIYTDTIRNVADGEVSYHWNQYNGDYGVDGTPMGWDNTTDGIVAIDVNQNPNEKPLATVTITNKYTPAEGYLIINKVLAEGSQKLNNGKDVFSFMIEAESGKEDGKVWYAHVDGNGMATLNGEPVDVTIDGEVKEVTMELPAGNYKITELSNINYTCTGIESAQAIGNSDITARTITVKVGGNNVTTVIYTNSNKDTGFTDGSGVINDFIEENGVISFVKHWIAGDKVEIQARGN